MVIQNYRDIKARAARTLSYTPWDVKKIVLVFGLVALCISPLLTGINALLLSAGENARGLSGLGVSSMLETAASVLNTAWMIFILFWTPGILYCALQLLREQDPWPRGLLRGFKKWAAFLKYNILIALFIFALFMFISPVVSIVSLPFMGQFRELLLAAPETEADMIAYLETVPTRELALAVMPMLILMLGVMLAILIPLSYRVRMVDLLLLDEERLGVREAIRYSFKLTKGSCLQLLRLDLSFWWYYLLIGIVSVLPMASELPLFSSWNATAAVLTCDTAAAVLGVGVYLLGLMKVKTAEAVAYDHLRTVVLTDAPRLNEGDTNAV